MVARAVTRSATGADAVEAVSAAVEAPTGTADCAIKTMAAA